MNNKVKPISPVDIVKRVPDFVLESFNELIQEGYGTNSSKVYQDDVIERILQKTNGDEEITRSTILVKKWLDVEQIYRNVGWDVVYKPNGFERPHGTFFMFSK